MPFASPRVEWQRRTAGHSYVERSSNSRKYVFKKRKVLYRGDRRARVTQVNKLVDRLIPGLPGLGVAKIIEVHDVALSEQVACEASNITRLY